MCALRIILVIQIMIKIAQFKLSGKISPKGNGKFLTSWVSSPGINRMNLLAFFSKSQVAQFYADQFFLKM